MLNDLTTIVVREVPLFCSCENNKMYEIQYQGSKVTFCLCLAVYAIKIFSVPFNPFQIFTSKDIFST